MKNADTTTLCVATKIYLMINLNMILHIIHEVAHTTYYFLS